MTDKNILLAIPFFIISGSIMTAGKISEKLINIAKAAVGWMPGGLAISTVFSCAFFAAISGSSPVTVIAIGTMMMPTLLKENYRENFSIGLITSSGSLGILIPPSIPMIIFAIVASFQANVTVSDLFLAGVMPGLFISLLLCLYAFWEGKRFNHSTIPFNFQKLKDNFKDGMWAMALPVIILGGIYSGFFTPTEASAVSVGYALVVELLIHQELKLKNLPGIIVESVIIMGSLLLIMVFAFSFNEFLVEKQIPQMMVDYLIEIKLSPLTFLFSLNIFLLVVGCFMDIISAILILVPIVISVAVNMGIHPIHLGIIFIVNLEIGYLTPPMGLNLFVSSSLFKKPIEQVIKSVLPFLLIMTFSLLVITYFPTLSIGPINLLKGKDFYQPLYSESKSNVSKTSIMQEFFREAEEAQNKTTPSDKTKDEKSKIMEPSFKNMEDEKEKQEKKTPAVEVE